MIYDEYKLCYHYQIEIPTQDINLDQVSISLTLTPIHATVECSSPNEESNEREEEEEKHQFEEPKTLFTVKALCCSAVRRSVPASPFQ